MTLDRITHKSGVMGGKPTIRGMRVTVGTIVGLVATGSSFAEILSAFPYLEKDDIKQALAYATSSAWSRFASEQFFAGYDEADVVYDSLK